MDIEKIFYINKTGGIIMKYYVEGKVFETENEASQYEEKLNEEKREKEELKAQKKARLDEITQKEKELQTLINQYYKDYGVKSGFDSWIDLFF